MIKKTILYSVRSVYGVPREYVIEASDAQLCQKLTGGQDSQPRISGNYYQAFGQSCPMGGAARQK